MKFGWCTTGHHSDCSKQFVDWNKKDNVCDCECHSG